MDENSVLVLTRSSWWKNLTNKEKVSVHLEGKNYQAKAEVIHDNSIVWDYISGLLKEHPNPRRLGIMLGENASQEEIRQAASDLFAVHFSLE